MNAQEAIQIFDQRVAEGRVPNSRDGTLGRISATQASAIRSCFCAAITFAAGKSDLEQIPYEAYADSIGEWATAEADAHGLKDGRSRASKALRLVRTVDGKLRVYRRRHGDPVPAPWKDLYELLQAHVGRKKRNYAAALLVLADALGPHGIREPEALPDATRIRRLVQNAGGINKNYLNTALTAYRHARRLALEIDPSRNLPDIDRRPIRNERGLRGLPDIIERLKSSGYEGSIRDISSADCIRILAPQWHAVIESFLVETERYRGRDWRKKTVLASSRYLASLVRSGEGELETAHPSQLLLRTVQMEAAAEPTDLDDSWAREFLDDSDAEDAQVRESVSQDIRLYELLAREMASSSAENSPLTVLKDDAEAADGAPYWTEVVIADTRMLAHLAKHGCKGTRLMTRSPRMVQEALASVDFFVRSMYEENARLSFAGRKAKERLLSLVTLPMVLCLGLPALRKRALRLQEEWQSCVLRHQEARHPRVVKAENAYDEALLDYLVLAVFLADGLRVANYAGARLGSLGRDTKVRHRAPNGKEVSSFCHIRPLINSFGDGLLGVETNFYGDDHSGVRLKIDKVPGSDEWREHPHWLRPGIVDMELFWDMLTRLRPRRLEALGLIPSADAYDLRRDMEEQNFALFVSSAPSSHSYRALTGAYKPETLSNRIGRALHWICTEVLGRDLPSFGPALRKLYPRVFCAHSTRLLLGTHLYGVLEDKTEAALLLNDTGRTVERRYSVVEASMVHKSGWEQPRFFDDLFARIWDKGEAIDWDRERPLRQLLPSEIPSGLSRAA